MIEQFREDLRDLKDAIEHVFQTLNSEEVKKFITNWGRSKGLK